MAFWCFAVLVLAVLGQAVKGEEKTCSQKTLFYEDLKCNPIYTDVENPCPHHFNCSAFDARPKDKCHFRGAFYGDKESIPSDLTRANCYEACRCRNNNGKMDIDCAQVECGSFWDPPTAGCQFKYDVNSCCEIGEVCPEKEDLVTCEYEGEKHQEGSRYISANRENTCVCNKDGNGTAFNDCRRNACLVELYFKDEFERYCAPVYMSKYNMCPVSMYCGNGTEKIRYAPTTDNENVKCRLGSQLWNIGDNFNQMHNNNGVITTFKCECAIPPFVTCYKNYKN